MPPTDRIPANRSAPPVPRGLWVALIAIAAVLAAVAAIGLAERARHDAALAARTAANAVPVVAVIHPQPLGGSVGLQLPGRLEAYAHAALRARVSGYLKRWTADIGAAVAAGELLAEIETPDLDQQLAQARADLAEAEADAELARITADRWRKLRDTQVVAAQEVDEKIGDHQAKQAAVKAARANVERLAAMQDFRRIVAPFAGIVTSRSTDIGALIDAGGGPALFTVADTSKLRVYVQVPQIHMPSIRIGQHAELRVPEYPGRTFTAPIASTAGAVIPSSGATLIQLVVDNARGELLPGGYAEVTIPLADRDGGASIPASSLIFDGSGTHVALLGGDGRVHMQPVTITRDLGKTVEVIGLTGAEQVIDSPPDSLRDGDAAQAIERDVPPPATAAPEHHAIH
mgnify:FL=1